MGLTFDELREALGYSGGPTAGDWYFLPGSVLDEFGAHKGPRPAILREDLEDRPRVHVYARSTTSPVGLEHAAHEAADDHPRSCKVNKRGRIVWKLLTTARRHIIDDTFSCTEPDAAVIDAVRRR